MCADAKNSIVSAPGWTQSRLKFYRRYGDFCVIVEPASVGWRLLLGLWGNLGGTTRQLPWPKPDARLREVQALADREMSKRVRAKPCSCTMILRCRSHTGEQR